jgi:hypothetical protein
MICSVALVRTTSSGMLSSVTTRGNIPEDAILQNVTNY